MTRDERRALYDAAIRYLGDCQLNPNATETDITTATAAVKRAEQALRGTPGTLLGITRRKAP
jgi:hypothetical protein